MAIIVLRTIILYAVIVFALRIMGKRQLGELQPSELVITILVSNLATLSMEDINIPILGSILPILMLVSCEVIVSVLCMKSWRIRKIVSGNPCIVIRNGIVDQSEMAKLRWTIDDLLEQLRANNIFDISEVQFAMVETSGKLSSYPKLEHRPLTPYMTDTRVNGQQNPPLLVISDGVLIKNALTYLKLEEDWIRQVLAERRLTIEDVFLMSCDGSKEYYITPKEAQHKG